MGCGAALSGRSHRDHRGRDKSSVNIDTQTGHGCQVSGKMRHSCCLEFIGGLALDCLFESGAKVLSLGFVPSWSFSK
jgi:hypothetical protein